MSGQPMCDKERWIAQKIIPLIRLMDPDDMYELYFAVTTDTCNPDPGGPPARYGVGWNL